MIVNISCLALPLSLDLWFISCNKYTHMICSMAYKGLSIPNLMFVLH